jgi:predicted butyrate kinase (DUF1464 family)
MESRLYLDNCSFDRKNQITKWKKIAKIDIDVSDKVESMANDIMKNKIKPKDSLHIYSLHFNFRFLRNAQDAFRP